MRFNIHLVCETAVNQHSTKGLRNIMFLHFDESLKARERLLNSLNQLGSTELFHEVVSPEYLEISNHLHFLYQLSLVRIILH
jgi:hypothetical protein